MKAAYALRRLLISAEPSRLAGALNNRIQEWQSNYIKRAFAFPASLVSVRTVHDTGQGTVPSTSTAAHHLVDVEDTLKVAECIRR